MIEPPTANHFGPISFTDHAWSLPWRYTYIRTYVYERCLSKPNWKKTIKIKRTRTRTHTRSYRCRVSKANFFPLFGLRYTFALRSLPSRENILAVLNNNLQLIFICPLNFLDFRIRRFRYSIISFSRAILSISWWKSEKVILFFFFIYLPDDIGNKAQLSRGS